MKKKAKQKPKDTQEARLARIEAWMKMAERHLGWAHAPVEACELSAAWACNHANEVPCTACSCPVNCYCRAHTCRER